MKLLVTGGAGYIGSHAVYQLLEAGHDVVVLDNLYSGNRWAIPEAATFVEGDVGRGDLLERLFAAEDFDGVLHFAAHVEVGESVADPSKYYRNNTVAALGLFEQCVKSAVRKVIFSSTAAVYGEPEVSLLKESAPLQPINPYGASKMMSERILQDMAAAGGAPGVGGARGTGLQYVILRYFNVAGARPDLRVGQATPRATHLVKVAAEAALGRRQGLSIFGTDYPTEDGTCERDYIHVEDLVRAHLDALAYLERGGRNDIFNVGYGRAYSVREVIETMKRVSGRDFKVVAAARRPGDPSALAADSTKLRHTLGWTPRYESLETICETALRWEEKLMRTGAKQMRAGSSG